jgi:hypothetical protein
MHIMCEAAPATREEEVMVTLRSGMRDAAEELHMGVRGRRREGGGSTEGKGKEEVMRLWVRRSSSAAANFAS